MKLEDLEVYTIAREICRIAWEVYKELPKEFRFSIGQQFLDSTDSTSANIAEGYGRFHYMDSVKFYYNARGSFWESRHWEELLKERGLIKQEKHELLTGKYEIFGVKLNNFISSVKKRVNDTK